MRKVKETFTLGIDLTGFPGQLSIGAMVNGKKIKSHDDLSDDQIAAVVCALDSIRFDFQAEFHRRLSALPTEGWFAGGEGKGN